MMKMISRRDINSLAKKIADQFRPQRIYLFGSYAYGKPNEHSDVDLMVLIAGSDVRDLSLKIRQAINFGMPVDLLVRSPEEFEARIAMGDFFLRDIKAQGKILYESADQGMGRQSRGRFCVSAARNTRKKIAKL
jgi:predicted nucleotidyltransferase